MKLPLPQLLTCLATAALLLSCGQPAPGSETAGPASPGVGMVRDSLALACQPIFQPGDSLPPRVATLARAADGTLAWQPAGARMLIILGPDGSETRISGENPAAPFIAARQLGWLADTLWLIDSESTRIRRFLADGSVAGPLLAPDFAAWNLLPGRLLRATAPRGIGPEDTTVALIGAHEGAGPVDTLAEVATSQLLQVHLRQGSRLDLLSVRSRATVSGSGQRWCTVTDGSGPARVACYEALSGALIWQHDLSLPRRALSDEVFNLVLRSLRFGREPLDSIRSLVPRPDSLPFAMALISDSQDRLWVGRSFPGEPVQLWLRLDPQGQVLDQLALPSRFTLLAAAGDSLWAAERDELGLERITACRIGI